MAKRGEDPFGLAGLYFSLGEKATGLEPLTRAFDQRIGFVRWANVDPAFDLGPEAFSMWYAGA